MIVLWTNGTEAPSPGDSALSRGRAHASRRSVSEHTNHPCGRFCHPFGKPENIGAVAPDIVSGVCDTAVAKSRGRLGRSPRSLLPHIPMYERYDPNVDRLKILTD